MCPVHRGHSPNVHVIIDVADAVYIIVPGVEQVSDGEMGGCTEIEGRALHITGTLGQGF